MRPWAPLSVSLLLLTACPKRTDEETRRAWEASLRDKDKGSAPGEATNGPGGEDGPRPSSATGWDRVREVIGDALDVMQVSPDAKAFARLAQLWCAVEPEPRHSEHGVVRVCNPDPPVRVGKHGFTLELGSIGVIGLVALDLSDADARQLAGRARAETERWCSDEFRERREAEHQDEVHTCTVQGGSTLAVARIKDETGSWLVSISVLSAT